MGKKPEPNPEQKRFVLIRSKKETVRCNAQSYWRIVGETQFMGESRIDAIEEEKNCHNCEHKNREEIRECQKCLDAGCFPLWEEENDDH